jgi:hypothetical protein
MGLIPLTGSLGIKYSAIMGDDMSDDNFTKNFGDLDQYMDNQYEISNKPWSLGRYYSNSSFTTPEQRQFMSNLPTVDGQYVFDHPDFHEFYENTVIPSLGIHKNYINGIKNWRKGSMSATGNDLLAWMAKEVA